MTEKQASSEIAQSRERFEKWAKREGYRIDRISDDKLYQAGEYCSSGVQENWEGWQAAERDTRKRVAKLARDIAKEVGGNFADTHRLNVGLNKFIQELERIRGKE